MRTLGQCKLCGQVKSLVKAHIIPRKFYNRIKGAKQALMQVVVAEKVTHTWTQTGAYDTGILCGDCDQRLGAFDEYAYCVLPPKADPDKIVTLAPGLSAYRFDALDAARFRMFLVALVWRAAITTHPLFDDVKIGPYEERLRQVLQGSRSRTLDAISVLIALLQPPKPDQILLPPYRWKVDGVNVVVFYLPPWKLLLKLDQRPFQAPLDQMALRDGRPTYAILQDLWSQRETKILNGLKRRLRAEAQDA